MITQVPELYDGGYWYRVPAVQDEDSGIRPLIEDAEGWCAWEYSSSMLVRVVTLLVVDDHQDIPIPKPYARIGGL